MSTRRRRTLTAALGVLAAAATTLTAAPAAFAAADPAVPADCSVSTTAYRADGTGLTYRYVNRTASAVPHPGGAKLGFRPNALQNRGAMGDTNFSRSEDYAVDKATSTLYNLVFTANRASTTSPWTYTFSKQAVGTGWAPLRTLALGYPYMYGITDTGALKRYSLASGIKPVSAGILRSSGWAGVQNLTYDRTISLGGTRKADVLLATNTGSDALVEYTVPHDTPTSITRTVLKTGGWGSFTSISTGWCSSHPNARVMLGIYADGRAKVFYDVNGADGKGTDLYGGTVVVATGWTEKSFSQ